MKRVFRIAQFTSNIAIIFIALLAGVILGKQYLFAPTQPRAITTEPRTANSPQQPTSRPPQENVVGKTVPIEDIDWKENKKTLVLYISTTCRYCDESSPFYRRLVKEASVKGVTLVAVLPQPVEEARKYLKSHDLSITKVYKTSTVSIGVTATPTLLLVNEDGIVSNSWRGRLQPDKENEVISKLIG